MFALGLFGKKPLNSSEGNIGAIIMNKLQELTGADEEMYRALAKTLFLDPKRIFTPIEEAMKQASDFESKGDRMRAEVWYRIAGGIALYMGDVAAVRKYFDRASSIAGDAMAEYKVLSRRAEDAVGIAGKFYSGI